MKFIVCLQQVPLLSALRFDPTTRRLVREGVPLEINELDVYALTEAIRLRELHGGEVVALTMGPPQAHSALAMALAMGADRAIHLNDRAFAGAEAVYPIKVVNFTDVIAEALGRGGHPDYYSLYKKGGSMDEAVTAARTFLQSNGVEIDETSVQSLTAEIFNETGLAGPREAFAGAFAELARRG